MFFFIWDGEVHYLNINYLLVQMNLKVLQFRRLCVNRRTRKGRFEIL